MANPAAAAADVVATTQATPDAGRQPRAGVEGGAVTASAAAGAAGATTPSSTTPSDARPPCCGVAGAVAAAPTAAGQEAASLALRLAALEKEFVVLRAGVRSGNELSKLAVDKMEVLALASDAMMRMMCASKARDASAVVVGASLERPGSSAMAVERPGASGDPPVALWAQNLSDDLNLRYVRLWCTPTTRAQIYLNSNGVTSLAVETIFSGLNVTEEAAKQVVFAKFRFPTKSDSEKFTIDNFAGYAKRDIATWHFKAKGMLFASYLEGLVSHKEYGHFVQRGRHRVPVLPRHQARALLEDNKFITSTTSYSALVAAIIDFISSVPEASCLLVACSQTVSEAFLRLLNAQFSWFTLKIRMELTILAGLPKLSSLGTNADEVMRKLWAIESQETAVAHDKKCMKYGRMVIVDGDDAERGCVSEYKEEVLAPLRRQMLVVPRARKDASGASAPSRGATGARAVTPALRAFAPPAGPARTPPAAAAAARPASAMAATPTATSADTQSTTATEPPTASPALTLRAVPASQPSAVADAPLAALAAAAAVLSEAVPAVPTPSATADVPAAVSSAAAPAALPVELNARASWGGGAAVAAVEAADPTPQVRHEGQGRMSLSSLDMCALRPSN